jgi:predicted MFS family arabinose efflux permease
LTSRADRNELLLLLASTFVLAAANSVVFALMSDLQDEYGLSTGTLGLISGAGFAVGLVVQLLVAPLADRGHPKGLLLGGLAVAVAGGVIFAAGSTVAVLVLARSLAGASIGCFTPAARAIVASLEPQRSGEHLGRLAAAELGGFTVGPVVGGALVGPFGVRVPFLVFAALAALAFLLLAPRRVPALPTGAESARPSLALLRHRGVVVATLFALVLFLPVGIYDSLWDRYLTDLGASNAFIGLTFALFSIPFITLSTLGGRVADRLGHIRACIIGTTAITPLVVVYGLLDSPVALALVTVVEAVFQALAVPAAQAAMADAAPIGRAAAAQGLAGATQLAGAALSAFVAAPVYGRWGAEVVFTGAALVLVAIAAVAMAIHRRPAVEPVPVNAGAR